jgi:RNA-binding protein YlmH
MGVLGREDADRVLYSHVQDLCERAAKGSVCCTAFLTPGQQRDVTDLLRMNGNLPRARVYGGFSDAERACILLFPDYAIELCDMTLQGVAQVRALLALCGEEDPVTALYLKGSGFCNLTHRDYLGSLLSLGLEREVLGDLELPDTHSAYLFCRTTMAPFIEESLERVGGDKITVQRVQPDESFVSLRRTQPLSDTVASARLDCVVAALANLSRESAQQLIREGRVELDYRMEERVDRTVATPATVSVRGVGKFRVISIGTQTKKGRFRLLAEKYI